MCNRCPRLLSSVVLREDCLHFRKLAFDRMGRVANSYKSHGYFHSCTLGPLEKGVAAPAPRCAQLHMLEPTAQWRRTSQPEVSAKVKRQVRAAAASVLRANPEGSARVGRPHSACTCLRAALARFGIRQET